jgi:glycine/D-amino acid oxidase-like deaminating enzyme
LYLRAGAVAVCNNAFAQNLFPELDVVPGRGQVLITEPVAKLPFKGAFHIDEGYYYFRNVGDRVLLGGGRNIDFQGEQSTELACTSPIMERLEYYLHHIILPGHRVEVAQRWAGIMAFGASKKPILRRYSNSGRIVTGVRMGGMGVAIGTQVGAEVALMLLNPSYEAAF